MDRSSTRVVSRHLMELFIPTTLTRAGSCPAAFRPNADKVLAVCAFAGHTTAIVIPMPSSNTHTVVNPFVFRPTCGVLFESVWSGRISAAHKRAFVIVISQEPVCFSFRNLLYHPLLIQPHSPRKIQSIIHLSLLAASSCYIYRVFIA